MLFHDSFLNLKVGNYHLITLKYHMPLNFNRCLVMRLFFICLTIFLATPSFAKDYSFSWSANDGDVDGYKLYYKKGGAAAYPFEGDDAFEGPSPLYITDGTSVTISELEDNTTYHFALTAYSGDDESDLTDIITVFPSDDQDTDQDAQIKQVLSIINNYLLLDQG